MPSPRSICGPNNSSIRPVPVPRSSSERNGLPASACDDRLLHRLVGGMQLADAIPFRRMRAEIILRGSARASRTAASRSRSRAITGSAGSSRSTSMRATPAAVAAVGDPEEGPGAFAMTLDQAGFRQQLEMARDARLRLAQDFGEVGDGQFGLGQQRKDAQPRALGHGPQRVMHSLEGQWFGFIGPRITVASGRPP